MQIYCKILTDIYYNEYSNTLEYLCKLPSKTMYSLFCVHSSFAIILKRKRKLVALLLSLLYCYC